MSKIARVVLRNYGHGRDGCCQPPPAQIPACAANAPGLYDDAAVKGIFRWCLAILIALGYGFRRAVKPRSRKAVRRRRRLGGKFPGPTRPNRTKKDEEPANIRSPLGSI